MNHADDLHVRPVETVEDEIATDRKQPEARPHVVAGRSHVRHGGETLEAPMQVVKPGARGDGIVGGDIKNDALDVGLGRRA